MKKLHNKKYKIKNTPFLKGVVVFILSVLLFIPTKNVLADTPVFDPVPPEEIVLVINEPWSYHFRATSTHGGIVYSIDGEIPGMILNTSTGEYSGMPTGAGSYTVTITATDANNDSNSEDISIEVVDEKIQTVITIEPFFSEYPTREFVTNYPVWVEFQLDTIALNKTPEGAEVQITTVYEDPMGNLGPACTATVNASGHGECSLEFEDLGRYEINVEYGGGNYYLESTSTKSIEIVDPVIYSPMLVGGTAHTCFMDEIGVVTCWGDEGAYYKEDEDSNRSSITHAAFKQISAGGVHSCGLKPDGSIACWGKDADINNLIPDEDSIEYIQLDSGKDHVCAIDTENKVHCWGELGTDLIGEPEGAFTQIDAGVFNDCAIDTENKVHCWGTSNLINIIPAELGSVKQVSMGSTHVCVIKEENNAVECWGVGFGTPPPATTGFSSLISGSNYTCGRKENNTVECWGNNSSVVPNAPNLKSKFLGGGDHHVCAVTDDNDPFLKCWGNNEFSQAPRLTMSPESLQQPYIPLNKFWSQSFIGTGGMEPYIIEVDGTLPNGLALEDMTLSGIPISVEDKTFSLLLSETFSAESESPYPFELLPISRDVSLAVQDPATSIVINNRTETANVGTPVVVNVTVSKSGTPDFDGFVTISGGESGVVCQAAVETSGDAECSLYFGTEGEKTITASYDGDDFYDPTLVDATTTTHIDPIVINPMVSAGNQFNCSINGSGAVTCWGKNDSNQLDFNEALTDLPFTSLSAGVSHVCGIATNRKVYCWGWDGFGVSTPPEEPGYTQVTSGQTHSCALNDDSENNIDCWGNSAADRLDFPSGLFSQIDAGANHTCAIRVDNSQVNCWGDNSFEQLNIGAYSSSVFNQISAGAKASCGVLSNGSLVCWGTLTAPPAGTYQSVSVGTDHACAINSNNELICWGNNTDNKTVTPSGIFNAVTAGSDHSCALRSDGFMKCWGNNSKGQAPVLSILPEVFPVLEVNQTWSGQLSVSGARSQNLTYSIVSGALPNGLTLESGTGKISGTVTVGNDFTYTVRVFEQDITPALIQEKTYTHRVKADTDVQVTEVNPVNPVVGQATWINITVDEAVNSLFGTVPIGEVSIYLDGNLRCEETLINGTATCLVFFGTAGIKSVRVNYAGDEKYLASTNLGAETDISVSPFEQTILLRSGDQQTYIHRSDGTLFCIGDGCNLEVFGGIYPVFDSGGGLSCGLQTDGQIKCLAGETESLYPGPFQNLAVGEGHACAIDLDGELICWGDNSFGQATPPIGFYTKIFAGENATCAIKNDQTLDCWGDPVVVSPPVGTYLDVSIGNGFACGLLSDGSINCWGDDVQGQLTSPTGTDFQQVVSGSHHTCALNQDGLVTCWGEVNDAPVSAALGTYFEMSAYQDHVCGLRAANEITCWGENDAGEAPQIVVVHLDDQEISAMIPWEHFFEPKNGVKPYIGTINNGNLPLGIDMELSTSGLVLFGTPTLPGRYNFGIHWIDSGDPKLVLEELYRLTVIGADLAVEITAEDETTALYDNDFWFDYEFRNQTELNAPNVKITINLPDGFENITYTGLTGCSIVDQQLTCLISEFVAESSLTLRVKGLVTQGFDQALTSSAEIISTQDKWSEVNSSDNTDQKSVTVQYKTSVLDEDFTTTQSPAWLSGGLITAPSGETYLGDFANAQELRLVINDLTPHRKVVVKFKLYVIGGWQGNGTILAPLPALYQFGQTGETAFTQTTFCNGDCMQAYPGPYPGGVNVAQTGASAINLLEFPATSDAVYAFEYRFDHNNPTLDLTWLSENLPTNARFGVDDVKVILDSGWDFVYLPLLIK